MPSNIELLALQARLDPQDLIVYVTDTTQTIAAGAEFPAPLFAELRASFALSPRLAPSERPRILDQVALDLAYVARPVYLIPRALPLDPSVHIADLPHLAGANPGNWHPIEWTELLAGKLGPVAIATVDDRVASICHTPGLPTAFAAEAGVWTHPDFRGRGLACATVAAWSHFAFGERHLFYSTTHDNLSSQRVAARLNLPALGWTHRLERRSPSNGLHPLCSLQT